MKKTIIMFGILALIFLAADSCSKKKNNPAAPAPTATPGMGGMWTEATGNAAFNARCNHTSVVYNNEMWVIGGYSINTSITADVWNSSDGVTWIQITGTVGTGSRGYHTSVVYNNKIWIIAGQSCDGNSLYILNDVWNSGDGIAWTQVTGTAAFSARIWHNSVVFNDAMWVIGGQNSTSNILNDVWYSNDGMNWTQATGAAAFNPRYGHTCVVYDNQMWVIGGTYFVSVPATNYNDVWKSSDGINWTQVTGAAGFGGRSGHTSVVYNNAMWVMAGGSKNGYYNDVWWAQ